MMNPNPAAQSYLRTKILTASPDELRLMLYDGAIKFCQQAKEALANSDFEASYHALMRAQKIVLELSASLDHEVAPDLCARLSSLYTFIYCRLVDANVKRDVNLIDESLKLLEYEKQTWQMLLEQMADKQKQGVDANMKGAQQTAISSLSTDA